LAVSRAAAEDGDFRWERHRFTCRQHDVNTSSAGEAFHMYAPTENNGLRNRSFHRYCARNATFLAETHRARAKGRVRIVDSILNDRDWRGKVWYLERTAPAEFGRVAEREQWAAYKILLTCRLLFYFDEQKLNVTRLTASLAASTQRHYIFLVGGLLMCVVSTARLQAASAKLTVMARTSASGLLSIDPNIAINKEGLIAFTGTDSTGSRVFVVSDPGRFSPVVNAQPGRTYAGVGLTSGANPAVVYRDFVPGTPIGFILRETGVSGTPNVILGSSVSVSGPADWDSITSNSIDANTTGTVVVSDLRLLVQCERRLTTCPDHTVRCIRPLSGDLRLHH